MEKKEHWTFKLLGWGIVVIFFIGFGLLFWAVNYMKIPELSEGISAKEFCFEKCGDYGILESNNNSEYYFIRCECLKEAVVDASPVSGARTRVKSFNIYFDSISLEELTFEEIKARIKNGSEEN
tara:strand:- start:52 stop:423 length:372 start_codon:yes stop_codon:yes gene_type:complete